LKKRPDRWGIMEKETRPLGDYGKRGKTVQEGFHLPSWSTHSSFPQQLSIQNAHTPECTEVSKCLRENGLWRGQYVNVNRLHLDLCHAFRSINAFCHTYLPSCTRAHTYTRTHLRVCAPIFPRTNKVQSMWDRRFFA